MLHIIAFFAAVCTCALLFKRKFEEALAPVSLCLMLVLTALGMLQKLLWADALAIAALALAALSLGGALLFRRVALKELGRRFLSFVLTPGLILTAMALVFFWYASEPMVVWWKDDIVQWGLEPKSLWFFNGLTDATRHLNLFFATYTPGLQVLQWWVMHIVGEWRESVLYFVLFSSYAVFLLPLCAKIRWRTAWLIPIALVGIVAFPVWGNVVSYVFLGVDTSLALCFGYVLSQIFMLQKGNKPALFSIAMGLCGLVLIKQIGLLFAAMAVLLLFMLKRQKGQSRVGVAACVLSPLVVWGGWMLFCQLSGLSGYHTSGIMEHISAMLAGSYVPPEGGPDVAYSLFHSLSASYTDSITYNTSALVHVPKLLWLIAIALAPLLLTRVYPAKEMKRLCLFISAMTVLYLLVQYASFFTAFYDETPVYTGDKRNNMFLLIERYMAPVMLGFGFLVLRLVVEASMRGLYAVCKPLGWLVGAAAVLIALSTNWGVMYEGLLPDRYYQQERAISVETDTLMAHDWGAALEGYEDAHVLVGLELNSDYIKNFRYTFAPAKFELPELSFTGSAEALSQYLIENKITHLICFDDVSVLYAPACELSEDGEIYSWTLYEVDASGDEALLVEFY